MSLEKLFGFLKTTKKITLPSALVLALLTSFSCAEKTSRECYSDYDCAGDKICINYQCRTPGNTPQNILDQFVQSLQEGNLEKTLDYFDLAVREQYKNILSQKNLSDLAKQLEQVSLFDCSGKRLIECSFYLGNEEMKTQFILREENGNEVYKIRNL